MVSSELEILEIISSVGQARNSYIQAIQEAKSHNYEMCNTLVRQGNEMYAKGHRIHQQLIQQEAGGEKVELNILLTHAQDQLMSAECFKILCDEFMDLYRRLDEMHA
ncbi:PTS lactose/cellobiose transporter subunit IIA [Amedibacillus sp. YH-ame10]